METPVALASSEHAGVRAEIYNPGSPHMQTRRGDIQSFVDGVPERYRDLARAYFQRLQARTAGRTIERAISKPVACPTPGGVGICTKRVDLVFLSPEGDSVLSGTQVRGKPSCHFQSPRGAIAGLSDLLREIAIAPLGLQEILATSASRTPQGYAQTALAGVNSATGPVNRCV